MAVGLFLLSNLHADTPIPVVWAWMFVAGVGIGPTFAVFTLIVQNGVPLARLGTATSNVTFFQQVGGTVGLAITGTIFASTMAEQVPRQIAAAQVPPELAQALAGGGIDPGQLTGVGDLGAAILGGLPDAVRSQVEPFIPVLVDAIYEAFSLATANTFTVGLISALAAAAVVLLLRDVPVAAMEPGPELQSATPRVGGAMSAPGQPRLAEVDVSVEDGEGRRPR
jgi:hypothetical protein